MFIYMSCVFSNVVETSLNSTKEDTDPETVLSFCSTEAFSLMLSPVSTVHSLLPWRLVWLLCLDGSKRHPHCCPCCPLNKETVYDRYLSTLTVVSAQLPSWNFSSIEKWVFSVKQIGGRFQKSRKVTFPSTKVSPFFETVDQSSNEDNQIVIRINSLPIYCSYIL